MENGWRGRIYQLTGQTPTSAFHRQLHSRSHQPKQHRPVWWNVKLVKKEQQFPQQNPQFYLVESFPSIFNRGSVNINQQYTIKSWPKL